MEMLLFLFVGGLAILFAIGMLLSQNAVHSALFLVGNFACIAVLFLMLNAPFLSMVQIAVYAGAIMVLFLFVIMLLGAEKTTDTTRRFRRLALVALVLASLFLVILGGLPIALGTFTFPQAEVSDDAPAVRVVHAAPDVLAEDTLSPQIFTLYLDDAEEPFATDFRFDEVAWVDGLAAGQDHVITFTTEINGNEIPVVTAPVTLGQGEFRTLVLTGSDPRFLELYEVDQHLDTVDDGFTRVTALNLYEEETVMLVDLGRNERLDSAAFPVREEQTVLDDNGDPVLDEAGEPVTELVLVEDGGTEVLVTDTVLIESIEPGAASEASLVEGGVYRHLALVMAVEGGYEIVRTLPEIQLERDTDQLLLMGSETLFDGNSRPLLVAFEDLSLNTVFSFGGPQSVGQLLFTDYMLPVQIVGVLLLVALVGVVVLTRPEFRQRRERGRRQKVSRPLVSVISSQTGRDVTQGTPRLDESAGD